MECQRPRGLASTFAIAIVMVFLALAAPLAGQVGTDPAYRIGPNDTLSIEVLEDEGLNVQRRVSGAGRVSLPLVGELEADGRTAEEVRAQIEAILEKDFLRQASVSVTVVEARSQPISITGAVRSPGTVYLSGRWTLSQAIAAAGGIDEANRGIAEIRRQARNGLADRLEVDLYGLLGGGDRSLDVPIFARDTIHVPIARDITVYFLGQISSQGAVTLKGTERSTLLTAIARAGGLTDRASSRLVIRRNRSGADPVEIEAHFRRILAGTDPDIELEDGDLIVVKEAFL